MNSFFGLATAKLQAILKSFCIFRIIFISQWRTTIAQYQQTVGQIIYFIANMDLKKTVEEQIDIILKLEDERKALLKENRILKDKVKDLTNTLTKYTIPKPVPPPKQLAQASTQIDPISNLSVQIQTIDEQPSQLQEAKELLRNLQTSKQMSSQMTVIDIYKENESKRANTMIMSQQQEAPPKKKGELNSEQLLQGQIIKLTKQINIMRKQNKDILNALKVKEKEYKELKKCFDLKAQNLEKAKKEFNELSILVNTDKFKNIRILEGEMNKFRQSNSVLLEQNKRLKGESTKIINLNDKLKQVLQNLTAEYEMYKASRSEQQQVTRKKFADMLLLVDKYKQQIWAYERNEKYLTESLKTYQQRLMAKAQQQ